MFADTVTRKRRDQACAAETAGKSAAFPASRREVEASRFVDGDRFARHFQRCQHLFARNPAFYVAFGANVKPIGTAMEDFNFIVATDDVENGVTDTRTGVHFQIGICHHGFTGFLLWKPVSRIQMRKEAVRRVSARRKGALEDKRSKANDKPVAH